MSDFWQGLLAHLAIVAGLVSVWTNLQDYLPNSKRLPRKALFGVAMAAGTLLTMSMHFAVAPGMIVDMRSALLATAGFFGGPLAGMITGLAALAMRLHLGGMGAWAGCFSIIVTTATGILGHRLVAGRPIRALDIALLALATTVAGSLGSFLLPPGAPTIDLSTMSSSRLMSFAATVLSGMAILQDERRRRLARSDMIYRAIIETLPDSFNAKDLDGRFIAANPATVRLMRAASAEALIGKTDFDFYLPDTAARFKADDDGVLAAAVPATIEQNATFADGSSCWLSSVKAPLRDARGRVIGLIAHNRDVTDKKRLRHELIRAQQRLEGALAHMADAMVLYDRNGVLELANPQYSRLFPLTADIRVPGARLTDIIRVSIQRGEQPEAAGDDLEVAVAERCRGILTVSDRLIHLADGRWLSARTRSADDGGVLILLSDVTARKEADDALAQANRQLEELAVTDALTGLLNRRGFDEALQREFGRATRVDTTLSLLLIDVDNFKRYNDLYGHQAGDDCLKAIGATLRVVLRRPADLVARYGGEELAAILPDTSPSGAVEVAEAFRCAVRDLRLAHAGSQCGFLTVSIGIASRLSEKQARRPEDLLRQADKALYQAKEGGRDQSCLAPTSRPAKSGLRIAS